MTVMPLSNRIKQQEIDEIGRALAIGFDNFDARVDKQPVKRRV